jgi:glycosyltransferase involved in cell wall biosynthesis
MEARNLRLQPWRYIYEVGDQLAGQGHAVTVLTDGGDGQGKEKSLKGLPLVRLPSVSSRWRRKNRALGEVIQRIQPDIILWHVGLSSFLHEGFETGWERPVIGIFTSPIYTWSDFARLGWVKSLSGYRLSAVHLLGTVAPKWLIKRRMRASQFQCLVVQTETVSKQLVQSGLWDRPVHVISPGVDACWQHPDKHDRDGVRASAGYTAADTVALYFGSPAPLRGLPTLLEALTRGRHADPTLKLLVLSRRRGGELLREEAALRRMVQRSPAKDRIQVIDGFLDEAALVRYLASCDLVVLPFELVSSDAPLSILEARTLGKPVVTTRLGCLPELTSSDYLAEPADPDSLADAIIRAAATTRSNGPSDFKINQPGMQALPIRSWQEVGEDWTHLVQSI